MNIKKGQLGIKYYISSLHSHGNVCVKFLTQSLHVKNYSNRIK